VQECQRGGGHYTGLLEAHPELLQSHSAEFIGYELHLKCASNWFSLVNVISDVVFLIDIILNFSTGFVPKRSSQTVYKPSLIAKNYLQDTFVFDAVATVPWEQVTSLAFWIVRQLLWLCWACMQ
jgi:hypothetical protein